LTIISDSCFANAFSGKAMYTTFFHFFGLRANPFRMNPDPSFFLLNHKNQSALDGMASTIYARKGLIVLTGEAGTGKTTLINTLRIGLEKQKIRTAFIFNPHFEVNELFELILANFGALPNTRHNESPVVRLDRWLVEQYQRGVNAVLILDEAQGLPLHLFEEIRMLLNHEIAGEKLLQIVLSGQPELEEKLKSPELRSIRQRISLRCQTRALTLEEAHGYAERRLQIAGDCRGNIFTPEAIDAAYLYSRGIPRVMNLLCEQAMIRAYSEKTQPVPARLMDEVARQLQFDDGTVRANAVAFLNMKPLAESCTVRINENPMMVFPTEHREVAPIGTSPMQDHMARRPLGVAPTEKLETGGMSSTTTYLKSLAEHTQKSKAAPNQDSEFTTQTSLLQELRAELVSEYASKTSFMRQPKNVARAQHGTVATGVKKIRRRSALDFSSLRQALLEGWNSRRRLSLRVLLCLASSSERKQRAPTWQRRVETAIHWLQQPLPTVKLRRRAAQHLDR
jgi:general secretion pathway protein A